MERRVKEGSDFRTLRQAVLSAAARLSGVGGGEKNKAPEEPLTGVNFNTLAPPVAMGRHYENISGCSMTLSSFRGSGVKGIVMTSAVEAELPAGNCRGRRNNSVGAEGQITAFDGVIEISQKIYLKPKLVAV